MVGILGDLYIGSSSHLVIWSLIVQLTRRLNDQMTKSDRASPNAAARSIVVRPKSPTAWRLIPDDP